MAVIKTAQKTASVGVGVMPNSIKKRPQQGLPRLVSEWQSNELRGKSFSVWMQSKAAPALLFT